MFTKKILAAAITSQPSASSVADAIDFDGATDYLSRSSDLVGNTDGKTFTFSAWVWEADNLYVHTIYENDGGYINISLISNGNLSVNMYGLSGSVLIISNVPVPKYTWSHILISVDLTNTTSRHVYVNDVLQTPTWGAYINENIDFARTGHKVGDGYSANFKDKGRLAHVFLDYTYRDLSIEANRRLFITADRKPAANQAALNPILYLPLNDPTQTGKNLGAGGDFALNGVVARSGRGPSQFNAPYSDLNGTSQYLSRTSALAGIADGKAFTFSFSTKPSADSIYGSIFSINGYTNNRFLVFVNSNANNIDIRAFNSAGTQLLQIIYAPSYSIKGRNMNFTFSVDLASSAKRHMCVNGVDQTSNTSWVTYTDGVIAFNNPTVDVAAQSHFGVSYPLKGSLGNVFFDTKYIDLSQPANLAKFVTGTGIDAKPADLGANGEKPFGTAPLIYLPMYGNNAGKNYGTGGDFTVNSGPFAGARGPNEFWGNKADFDGSTGYLARTSALSGVSDGKTFSFSLFVNKDVIGVNGSYLKLSDSTGNVHIILFCNTSNQFSIMATNATSSTILHAIATTTVFTTSTNYHILGHIDLTSTVSTNRQVWINGVSQSITWATYTNDTIPFTQFTRNVIGARWNGTSYADFEDGKIAELYFTTEYIDFSQEANRLKFRDAFGNPVDLAPQIAAGTLPNPAIYMRFDPANFGKNSGTGGDFVVAGTITDGGQL